MEIRSKAFMAKVIHEGETYVEIEVPTSMPEPHRFISAIVEKSTNNVKELRLRLTADYLEKFLAFQYKSGFIEREPTQQELSVFMQNLSPVLEQAWTNCMTFLVGLAKDTLGVSNDDYDVARVEATLMALVKCLKGVKITLSDDELNQVRQEFAQVLNDPNMEIEDFDRVWKSVCDRYIPDKPAGYYQKLQLLDAFAGNGCIIEMAMKYAEAYWDAHYETSSAKMNALAEDLESTAIMRTGKTDYDSVKEAYFAILEKHGVDTKWVTTDEEQEGTL